MKAWSRAIERFQRAMRPALLIQQVIYSPEIAALYSICLELSLIHPPGILFSSGLSGCETGWQGRVKGSVYADNTIGFNLL